MMGCVSSRKKRYFVSPTVPTTRRSRPVLLKTFPSASLPKNSRANCSFTITTPSAEPIARSSGVKSRPASSGIPSVRKYPLLICRVYSEHLEIVSADEFGLDLLRLVTFGYLPLMAAELRGNQSGFAKAADAIGTHA